MKIADIDSLLEISFEEAAAIRGSGFFSPITAAAAIVAGMIVGSNPSPNETVRHSNQGLPPDFRYEQKLILGDF